MDDSTPEQCWKPVWARPQGGRQEWGFGESRNDSKVIKYRALITQKPDKGRGIGSLEHLSEDSGSQSWPIGQALEEDGVEELILERTQVALLPATVAVSWVGDATGDGLGLFLNSQERVPA